MMRTYDRRRWIIGLGVLAWITVMASGATSLVVNGDFENGRELPEGWEWKTNVAAVSGGTITWDSDEKHEGKRAIRLSETVFPENGVRGRQVIEQMEHGRMYRLSAWIKGEAIVAKKNDWFPYILVQFRSESGEVMQTSGLSIPHGKTHWTLMHDDFVPMPRTKMIELTIGFFGSKGTFWVDDLQIMPITSSDVKEHALQSDADRLLTRAAPERIISMGRMRMTLAELISADVNVISHVPARKELFDEANKLGIRVLPYISLYKCSRTSHDPFLLDHPFWKEVDAARSPAWFAISKDGSHKLPFGAKYYYTGFMEACQQQRAFHEGYVRGISNIMAAGGGGVFVDNVPSVDKNTCCYGADLHLHSHADYPDQSPMECYTSALMRGYSAVKSYGSNKLYYINTAGTKFWMPYGNVVMNENFISAIDLNKVLGTRASILQKYGPSFQSFWHLYNQVAKNREDVVMVVNQVYLSDLCSADEVGLYSFVFSKLLNLQNWMGSAGAANVARGSLSRTDITRLLFREMDLGSALTPPIISENWACQGYQRGIIVLNAAQSNQTVVIPAPNRPGLWSELLTGEPITIEQDMIQMQLPGYSGRIVLPRHDVLRNYLREVQGQSQSVRILLESYAKNFRMAAFDNPAYGELLRKTESDIKAILRSDRLPVAEAVNALNCALAEAEPEAAFPSRALRLREQTNALTAEAVLALFAAPGAMLPREAPRGIYDAGLEKRLLLRSAGAAFELRPRLRYGLDAFFNIAAAPLHISCCLGEERIPYGYHAEAIVECRIADSETGKVGLYHLDKFRELQVLEDSPQRYRVAAVAMLAAAGQPALTNRFMRLLAQVEQGSPFIDIEYSVIDRQEQPSGETILMSFPGTYMQADATTGAGRASQKPATQSVDWVHFFGQTNSYWGTVVVGSNLCVTRGKLQSAPNGVLRAKLMLSTGMEEDFLGQRLGNARRYASQAAAVVNGLGFRINSPELATMGQPLSFTLDLQDYGGIGIKHAAFTARAEFVSQKGGRRQVQLIQDMSNGAYQCQMQTDIFHPRDVVVIDGWADVTLMNGNICRLETRRMLRLVEAMLVGNPVPLGPAGTAGVRLAFPLANRTAAPKDVSVALKLKDSAVHIEQERQDLPILPEAESQAIFVVDGPGALMNTLLCGSLTVAENDKTIAMKDCVIKLSPRARVPRLTAAPSLDGDLADAAWNGAAALTDFSDNKTNRPAADQTRVLIGYTSNALHIAVHCHESDMSNIVHNAIPDNEGASQYATQDDCVELYFGVDAASERHTRLVVTSAGIWRSDEIPKTWEHCARLNEADWVIEFSIPFAALGRSPQSGDVWRFNVARAHVGKKQASVWSTTYGGFKQPDRFGWLTFD